MITGLEFKLVGDFNGLVWEEQYDYLAEAVHCAETETQEFEQTIRLFLKTTDGWEFLGIFEKGKQLRGE